MKYAYINPSGWLIGDTVFWGEAWLLAGRPVKVIEMLECNGVEIAICSLLYEDTKFEVPVRHLKEI